MRDIIAALFAVLLVGGVAGGAWWLLDTREEADPAADAVVVLDAYLAAWQNLDVEGMVAELGRTDEDFRVLHRQMFDALTPLAIRVTPGPLTLTGPQADTDLTVEIDLPDADTMTYTSPIRLLRTRGEWEVVWTPATLHPDLRPGLRWEVVTTPTQRDAILAADGAQLTGPGEVTIIGIEPRRIEDPGALLNAFAQYAPEGEESLRTLLARTDLNPSWFYPVVRLGPERFAAAWDQLRPFAGVIQRTQEDGRLTVADSFAYHVLGRVGPITRELLDQLGPPWVEGDELGLFGLEQVFEDELTGSPALQVRLVEADDDIAEVVHEFQGDPSGPVSTTLDRAVQQAAENAVVGLDGKVAIVAVDGATGAIRAAVSRPLTDYNRGFAGRFPPGTSFEIVTAYAALLAGRTPDDVVACPARAVVGGLEIRNPGDLDLGEVTLEQAFAASCRTTFAQLAETLGDGALEAAATTFGFNTDSALPLDSVGGSFPVPADLAEEAAAAVGQARVEASALHMATVAAAAGSGAWHVPFLLANEPSAEVRELDPGALAGLQRMLRAAVAGGNGTAAEVAGRNAIGTSGSADFGDGDPPPTHAWFVGADPATGIGFAILVEGGGSGSDVAAPIAGRFLTELAAVTTP